MLSVKKYTPLTIYVLTEEVQTTVSSRFKIIDVVVSFWQGGASATRFLHISSGFER